VDMAMEVVDVDHVPDLLEDVEGLKDREKLKKDINKEVVAEVNRQIVIHHIRVHHPVQVHLPVQDHQDILVQGEIEK